jgi:dTDP-glucose pyrophosphorylase
MGGRSYYIPHSNHRYINTFKNQHSIAKVLLKRVGDSKRFGVAAFDEQNKMIIQFEEKPERPKSDYSVIGVNMYNPQVFDIIRGIAPPVPPVVRNLRSHWSITDMLNTIR